MDNRNGVRVLSIGILLTVLFVLSSCDISNRQKGPSFGNFLIRPSSGNSFSAIVNHDKTLRTPTHTDATTSTSGSDLEPLSSFQKTSPASPLSPTNSAVVEPDVRRADGPPPDLFPEFLPMENSSATVTTNDDLSVGSGDGEILDWSTDATSSPVHRVILTSIAASTEDPLLEQSFTTISSQTSQVSMHTTTASSTNTLGTVASAASSPTVGPGSFGFYKFRENKILNSNNEGRNTSWQQAFLPEQRNLDQEPDRIEAAIIGHHEGWTPFTISHTNLPKFLFSTLMMQETVPPTEPTTSATQTEVPVVTTSETTMEATTVEPFVPVTTGLPAEAVTFHEPLGFPVTHVIQLSTTNSPASIAPLTGNTTFPRPMIFWSDKPDRGQGSRTLFAEDDGYATVVPVDVSAQKRNDTATDMDISKKNISREALDNLITVIMKYVGAEDFIFSNADKKTLAELILWPIIYENAAGNVSEDYGKSGATTAASHVDVIETPWPVLRFIAPTPRQVDGVWVLTAYVAYRDSNSSIMPRTKLLGLVHDAELKLMTKMNLQLARVYPGLPLFPFNSTDLKVAPNDYHPLFERFSSLFIPLIVLGAICAFVAIITVVCLVKKGQSASKHENENKEKILRPVDTMGVENHISDETMKSSERPHSNTTIAVSTTSAKEMYETEGWVVPLDPSTYPPLRRVASEEDTKL